MYWNIVVDIRENVWENLENIAASVRKKRIHFGEKERQIIIIQTNFAIMFLF